MSSTNLHDTKNFMTTLLNRGFFRYSLAILFSSFLTWISASTVDVVGMGNTLLGTIVVLSVLLVSLFKFLAIAQDWNDKKQNRPRNSDAPEKTKFEIFDFFFLAFIRFVAYGFMLPLVLYIPVRLVMGVLVWLKSGVWEKWTACTTLDLFCMPSTNAIGLNKILYWFGANDVGFVLAFGLPIGLYLLLLLDGEGKF